MLAVFSGMNQLMEKSKPETKQKVSAYIAETPRRLQLKRRGVFLQLKSNLMSIGSYLCYKEL
jgi:hypothetical protein